MIRPRRPILLLVLLAAALAAAAIAWWLLHPIRWDDSRNPPPELVRARELLERGDVESGYVALTRALRRYRAPDWEDSFRILGAIRLLDADRAEEALALVRAPFPDGSALDAHATLARARALLGVGRAEEAARAARSVAEVDGFPGAEEAERVFARALVESGRSGEAIERLESSGAWPLRLEAARLASRSGDTAAARRLLASAVLESGPGEVADRALEILAAEFPDPRTRLEGTDRSRVVRVARRWIDARRAARALDLLRRTRPPETGPPDLIPEEALVEALALHQIGLAGESLPFLARASQGDAAIRDGAAYLRARFALHSGRSSAWRAGLEALGRRPGRSEWKIQALRDLAILGEGAPSATTLARYRRYREVAGADADPTAQLREFWAAYDLRRRADADAALARILALPDAPSGVRAAALFWKGRRLEENRRGDEARRTVFRELAERYGNHYYGAVLERHLGKPAPRIAHRRPDPPAAAAPVRGGRWLEAARALRSAGLRGAAADAYRAAIAEVGGESARAVALEAALAALSDGAPTDALGFAETAAGDLDSAPPEALPVSLWRLFYPAPAADVVSAAARREGIDPRFLNAVIREESAFNPVAVSSAGARGLLQLMPAVGAEWADRLRMRGFRVERLFEPELNLRLGTAYLRALLDRFPSQEAALAAYNAGPTRAYRWSVPGDAPEVFVERIPIPETRLYVKRIVAAERFYRVVWPDGLAPDPSDPLPDAVAPSEGR